MLPFALMMVWMCQGERIAAAARPAQPIMYGDVDFEELRAILTQQIAQSGGAQSFALDLGKADRTAPQPADFSNMPMFRFGNVSNMPIIKSGNVSNMPIHPLEAPHEIPRMDQWKPSIPR
jgi:hypothetical protein